MDFYIFYALSVLIIIWVVLFLTYKKEKNKIFSISWLPNIFLIISLILVFIWFFSYNFSLNKKQNLNTSNILFLLDVSKSMNALDYEKNISRLNMSKEFIINYISNNPNNKYGLSVFAWDVVDIIPFTLDKDLFLTFLNSVDEKSVLTWWSDFYKALKSSKERFLTWENWWWIIILSDFEPTNNNWNYTKKEIEYTLDKLKELNKDFILKNIKTYFIWVWNSKWNKIFTWVDILNNPIFLRDFFNNEVVTKLDLNFLDKIKNIFSWESYIISQKKDLENISFTNIPSSLKQENIENKQDISRYIMIISYIFFLWYLILFYYFDRKWN